MPIYRENARRRHHRDFLKTRKEALKREREEKRMKKEKEQQNKVDD